MNRNEIIDVLEEYRNTGRKLYKQAKENYEKKHYFSDLLIILDVGTKLHEITIEDAKAIWENEIREFKKEVNQK